MGKRTAALWVLPFLLGQTAALAQQEAVQEQSPAERPPAYNPGAGPDAQPVTGPSEAQDRAGEDNPAAASASGCGTTDAELAATPPGETPCPGPLPTPGSGQTE